MTRLAFRFDIDTHLCLKKGVPLLLQLAEDEEVPFSFFLNTGKSVSVKKSIAKIIFNRKSLDASENEAPSLSALTKLGVLNYLYAAIFNPVICKNKSQILEIWNSECELGIHGGRNHAIWMEDADKWTAEKYFDELNYSIANIKQIIPDYKPNGFISPGFKNNDNLFVALDDLGFKYCSDEYEDHVKKCKIHNLDNISINILGMPGGIAYFESCRASRMTDEEIEEDFFNRINMGEDNIVYDHPYYAGIKEIVVLRKIIERAKKENINIVKMEDLL